MKLLALTTSRRAWGNSDLIAATALTAAAEAGAEIRLLRLADLNLAPCTGCMRCIFKNCDCVIPDRLGEALEALRWADGVVIAAPTYVLEANSILKNLQDRLVVFGMTRELKDKPAGLIATAGVRGWEGFVLTQLTSCALFLGMKVVDRFVAHAQGPGEVLDNAPALTQAKRLGQALASGETGYIGAAAACPLCHLDTVEARPPSGGHCTLCGVDGTWVEEGGDYRFVPTPGAEPRWGEGPIHHHFHVDIIPSGPRFKENMKEITRRVGAFKKDFAAWQNR